MFVFYEHTIKVFASYSDLCGMRSTSGSVLVHSCTDWGGVSIPGGGLNFSHQSGLITSSSNAIFFCLRHSLLLTVYLFMKDKVSLAQAKIFINGIIKVQNQAIGIILPITILKVLPKDKKGEGVLSPFQRGAGADFSHQSRV